MACCQRLKEEVDKRQIETLGSTGEWAVPGCCGGGCYVLYPIYYCPFCGTKLEEETRDVDAEN